MHSLMEYVTVINPSNIYFQPNSELQNLLQPGRCPFSSLDVDFCMQKLEPAGMHEFEYIKL